MYKIYFKQAIQMLKQNKFISIVAITGTALAIMMIMAILVSEEVKTISVAPEVNRDRTYYIRYQVERDTVNQYMSAGNFTADIIREYLSDLQTPECVSAVSPFGMYTSKLIVNREGDNNYIKTHVRSTDANYWKIFAFSFLEGKPFSREAFDSGIGEAVINESTARKLFRGAQAVGQTILVSGTPFRITGIVKDVSPVFKQAYGDIWLPYTSLKRAQDGLELILLARSTRDYPAIAKEIRDVEKKYLDTHAPQFLYLPGPEDQHTFTLEAWGGNQEESQKNIAIQHRKKIFILLILLLIPAINLSGLSLSRVRKRTAEIGVRKAFGAKRYIILFQVLYENLITSLIGGVIGLILSYAVIYQMRFWLLSIPAGSPIPGNTLLSFPVFITVFVVCLLINLLSAGIPAYRASRMTIIHSLNQNEQ